MPPIVLRHNQMGNPVENNLPFMPLLIRRATVRLPIDSAFFFHAGRAITDCPMTFSNTLPVYIQSGIRNVQIFFQPFLIPGKGMS